MRSGRWRPASGCGLVQLLLAATLLVAVFFYPLGEQLQCLLVLVGVEVAVGAEAEGEGIGLLLDGVGGLG